MTGTGERRAASPPTLVPGHSSPDLADRLATALRGLVPPTVAVATGGGEAGGVEPAPLFAIEASAVSGAVASRRHEFAAGRACARRALSELGVAPGPIPVGPKGEPQWPAGTTGSISHCSAGCAAMAAPTSAFGGIGLDLEVDQPLPNGVVDVVATGREREWLGRAGPGPSWDTLVFVIKESAYKAWYPSTRRWLEFHDVDVSIDPATNSFTAAISAPAKDHRARRRFDGRVEGGFALLDGLLVAVSLLPAAGH